MRSAIRLVCCLSLLAIGSVAVAAEKAQDATAYPLAILPFQERDPESKGLGAKVSDLLYADLVARPELTLVDREDLKKTLGELELNISGAVKPDQAAKVGQLTGAKLLVTGTVMQVEGMTILVAKVIGVENSRIVGATVKGKDGDVLTALVDQLGKGVSDTIIARADELVVKLPTAKDRVAELNKVLGKAVRPSVNIKVQERHVGPQTIDPAVETELGYLCKETGFEVLANRQKDQAGVAVTAVPGAVIVGEGTRKVEANIPADIMISGEGFSETAGRVGNMFSVRARIEVKAVERETGKVLAVDRQTAVVVDLSEQIAGKAALQQAAAELADRLIPKLVKSEKK